MTGAFDPAGPLPAGTVVLEASAGTGKTWTIAALVARYVAEEGVPLEEILVVTFTRAATTELRDRVRARLVEALRHLRHPRPGAAIDPVLGAIAAGPPEEIDLRAGRLDRALRSFDRATITTLHGFAIRLLALLGLRSGVGHRFAPVADFGVLADEVRSDLYVRRFAEWDDPPLTPADLAQITAAVTGNPDARIVPDPATVDGVAQVRSEVAAEVRDELRRRADEAGIVTYDDLLIAVREALYDEAVAGSVRRLVRSRFRVALIDEFQDTDRVQWQVAEAIFGPSNLVLIGDPKQAIYAFRGADVDAYLAAADTASRQETLTVNWRSDGPLLDALDAVLDGVSFGDPRIAYRKVSPAPGREGTAITGVPAPLQLRVVSRDAPIRRSGSGFYNDDLREYVAADAADVIVGLLQGARRTAGDVTKRLAPGDIGVLCRTHREVAMMQDALRRRAVPSVVGRTGSVLDSPAAGSWMALLTALERPQSAREARRVAVTPFVGWSLDRLAAAAEEDLLPLNQHLVEWSETLRDRGVPALLAGIEAAYGMTARVLASEGGERELTDLWHLAEVLHAGTRGTGIRSLAEWLAGERQAATEEDENEARSRRLETDADAVQLLTIHGVKGLQFPVVLCPFLWAARWEPPPAVPVFHDREGRRLVDVGGKDAWPGFAESVTRRGDELDAEDFRLLYVALTRAQHHLAVWWGPGTTCAGAPLTKVLFGRSHPGDRVDASTRVMLTSPDHIDHLGPITGPAGDTIAVVALDGEPAVRRWAGRAGAVPDLDRARFDRAIDATWRRTSFTGLTDEAARVAVTVEAGTVVKDDELPEPEEPLVEPPPVEMPIGAVRGGLAFGNLVHAVFEDVDFTAGDLGGRLTSLVTGHARAAGMTIDVPLVARGLEAAILTPLGPGEHDLRLADLPPQATLREMVFEVPVRPEGEALSTADLARVLEEHLDPGHPLAPYPARLAAMGGARFRGYLSGAIDLVVRLPDGAGGTRWWVADYKSNRLPAAGLEPRVEDYAPGPLAAAMVEGDYVLQALLYRVALHRYLRWRLPGYDPARDLGGSLYLFVRGMVGAETEVRDGGRCGVAVWDPDPALVTAVADLFAGAGR